MWQDLRNANKNLRNQTAAVTLKTTDFWHANGWILLMVLTPQRFDSNGHTAIIRNSCSCHLWATASQVIFSKLRSHCYPNVIQFIKSLNEAPQKKTSCPACTTTATTTSGPSSTTTPRSWLCFRCACFGSWPGLWCCGHLAASIGLLRVHDFRWCHNTDLIKKLFHGNVNGGAIAAFHPKRSFKMIFPEAYWNKLVVLGPTKFKLMLVSCWLYPPSKSGPGGWWAASRPSCSTCPSNKLFPSPLTAGTATRGSAAGASKMVSSCAAAWPWIFRFRPGPRPGFSPGGAFGLTGATVTQRTGPGAKRSHLNSSC